MKVAESTVLSLPSLDDCVAEEDMRHLPVTSTA